MRSVLRAEPAFNIRAQKEGRERRFPERQEHWVSTGNGGKTHPKVLAMPIRRLLVWSIPLGSDVPRDFSEDSVSKIAVSTLNYRDLYKKSRV